MLFTCCLMLVLVLSMTSEAEEQQTLYHRGGVRRGPVPLVAPNAPLSWVQCGALCSRLPTCRAWRRSSDTGLCAAYPAPADGLEGTLDTESYQQLVDVPEGYAAVSSGIAYRALTATGSQSEGAARCLETDPSAVLAAPDSDQLMEALRDMVEEAGGYETYLGIKSQAGGDYIDEAGQPVPVRADWFKDDVFPDYAADKTCVVIKDGNLDPHSCGHNHRAACQVQLASP